MSKAQDEDTLSAIFLPHSYARWVLMQFNQLNHQPEDKFEAFLTSLKLLGVPFSARELSKSKQAEEKYLFENLMEVFLLMRLQAYGYHTQGLADVMIKHRAALRDMFANAYFERQSGRGAPRRLYVSKPVTKRNTDAVPVMIGQIELATIRGMYLDIRFNITPKGELDVVNLELIGPEYAASQAMLIHRNIYPHPPLPLSNMADDLVRIATSPIPAARLNRSKFLK